MTLSSHEIVTIGISDLARTITPSKTTLLFGAGSSIPSGAPSANDFKRIFSDILKEDISSYNFNEAAEIVEIKRSRRLLADTISNKLKNLTPTGGILNLPRFNWRLIATTNYDEIIEKVYKRVSKEIFPISSDFDFSDDIDDNTLKLFKIHGTIFKDTCYGNMAPMIITSHDYSAYDEWREKIYAHLFPTMISSSVIIIGHSLSDPHLNEIIDRCILIKNKYASSAKIYCLVFQADETKALLLERRGISVCFGHIDSFAAEMMKSSSEIGENIEATGNPLDVSPSLHSTVIEVSAAIDLPSSSIRRMFEGSPVAYEDALGVHVFEREIPDDLRGIFANPNNLVSYVIGAAGVGKTSAIRIFLAKSARNGDYAWEHKNEFTVSRDDWIRVGRELRAANKIGYLFFDDYQKHSRLIDSLIDALIFEELRNLKIVLACHPALWSTRTKSSNIFSHGKKVSISKLSDKEIEFLVDLHSR